ncbi:MoxR family ATPase [Micromonospora sp. HM5-17]|jgi:MoxR-like ATPase|uniref:AAA family ATPase n=1 Tax=Micromonospora sp. HM5-17 TaxID=2487710 RepID=UPI000F47D350|nr:MoxR family ATPase [Micromonospora sp. HM5-17]ROT31952.1 MoxR family ATPase [Micromonospora sp. HM5-17]
MPVPHPTSPAEVAAALAEVGYLADEGLAAAVFLAVRLRRPLFLEGEPGVGKTALAEALARVLGASLIRLQCYAGIDASQALYDWNFPRQLLRLRALGEAADAEAAAAATASLYTREFLVARPVLQALENAPAVLLVDEIDRADDEFEAFLLEVLESYAVSIPELGTIRAAVPPLVVLTSNRSREVHDALKRRCLYHWIAHPDVTRETEILRRRLAGLDARLAADIAAAMARLRRADLVKPPGIAESLDLARAALELGESRLSPTLAEAALGTVAKHHEDRATVRRELARPAPPDGRAGSGGTTVGTPAAGRDAATGTPA